MSRTSPDALSAVSTRRQSDRRKAAGAFLAYLTLAVLLLGGAWGSPLTRNAGAGGDMPIFAWSLRWAPWALGHLHNPLFTTHLNYKAGANLMWNTSVLLPGVLVAPVTLLGGPVLAFNVLATLGIVLPAWTMYGALRLVTRYGTTAWVGGLAWAFGPWLLAQTRGGHLHLTLGSVALPLLARASYEIFLAQRLRTRTVGLIVGAGAAAWLFIGEESLAIAALAVGFGLAACAACHRGWWASDGPKRLRYAAAALGWTLVAFCPLAAVPVAWQLNGPQQVHGAIFPDGTFDADLIGTVAPTPHQLIRPASRLRLRSYSEEGAYLGLPLLLCAGAVIVCYRRLPAVRAAAATLVMLWVCSLGSRLHIDGRATRIPLPWLTLRRLPLLDNLLPVRLSMAVGALAAGLLAVGVDRAWKAASRPRATARPVLIGGGALGLLCLLALAPSLPFRSTRVPVPSYFTSSQSRRIPAGSLVMVAPVARPERPWVQLWQADAGLRFRMEGGYMLIPDRSGHASFAAPLSPTAAAVTGIETSSAAVEAATVSNVAGDLRGRGVSSVIVGPMRRRADVVRLFTLALGVAPRTTGGVDVWYGVPSLLARAGP